MRTCCKEPAPEPVLDYSFANEGEMTDELKKLIKKMQKELEKEMFQAYLDWMNSPIPEFADFKAKPGKWPKELKIKYTNTTEGPGW